MKNLLFQQLPIVLVLALLLSACDNKKTNPLDVGTSQPFVSWVALSPDTVYTDTLLTGGTPSPNDIITIHATIQSKIFSPDGMGDIRTVRFRVVKEGSSQSLAEGSLRLDSLDDSRNGWFSGSVAFSVRRVNIGNYYVHVYATANSGIQSNSSQYRIRVTRFNTPPYLISVSAPDTITLPPSPYSVIFKMYVAANDSDGIEDVERVYFRNLDSPSDTNRQFLLLDDGVQSTEKYDSLALDGIYSGRFQLPWNTPPQTYRFEFASSDQLGAISNRVVHQIVVRQP